MLSMSQLSLPMTMSSCGLVEGGRELDNCKYVVKHKLSKKIIHLVRVQNGCAFIPWYIREEENMLYLSCVFMLEACVQKLDAESAHIVSQNVYFSLFALYDVIV